MKRLRILHFNDVYHIKERTKEPLAGAARFKTALDKHRIHGETLTVCSGDCFAPSLESSISRGKHWPPIYNLFGIDVSCIGNHDFDFGVAQLVKLSQACNFPWLLSNVVDSESNDVPVAQAKRYHVINMNNLRIGFIGLAEEEWLLTIQDVPSYFKYVDFVEESRRLVKILKQDEGVDLIIALTHMRIPNDKILAEKVPEIDLILGGHDHFYRVETGDQDLPRIVKSGSDFMDLSVIDISVKLEYQGESYVDRLESVKVERVRVSREFEPDKMVADMVNEIWKELSKKLSKVLCVSSVAIDARTETSRTIETNLGSFTADIMRIAYDCDVAVLVGGTIRADRVYEPGNITMGDVMDIYPYEDPIVVVSVTGDILWKVLENGVSAVPKHEGRFPQVSGIHFKYDSSRKPMDRLMSVSVLEHGQSAVKATLDDYEPLELERRYTLATRGYILGGQDGYEILKSPEVKIIVGQEDGLMPSILLRRFFHGLASVQMMMSPVEDLQNPSHKAREKYRKLLRKAMHRSKEEKQEISSPKPTRKQHFIPTIAPITTGRIIDVNKNG